MSEPTPPTPPPAEETRIAVPLWKKAAALALVPPIVVAIVLGITARSFLISIVGWGLGGLLYAVSYVLRTGHKIKGAPLVAIVVAIAVLAGILVVHHMQRLFEPERDRVARLVKLRLNEARLFLKEAEGIDPDVEPVVELNEKVGNAWMGTATYGEMIYDLRISKDPGSPSGWRVEIVRRAPGLRMWRRL
jgi:hypothetical protein